jgi:two-component system phosphate regulon sensor histidine kinase PhoR
MRFKTQRLSRIKEKVFKYLQMIRDEKISECTHKSKEFPGISKLEKKELDIEKESSNIEEVISQLN